MCKRKKSQMMHMYKEHIYRLEIEYMFTRDDKVLDEINYTKDLLHSISIW